MRDGDMMRIRAESGFSPALIEYAQARPIRAGRETFTGRAALSGEVVHIPDVLADPDYDYGERRGSSTIARGSACRCCAPAGWKASLR